MARRTKEEALETRTLILDTAEWVFRDKGVGHTTLSAIAAAAGVTRGAIYWHFENKAALLQAVNDRVHLPLEAMNEVIADPGLADPLATLRDAARFVLNQAAHDEHARLVFEIFTFKCEYVDEMADMLTRQRDSRRACLRAIAENLRHCVEKGQLPAGVDADGAAIGLFAVVDGLIGNWLMDPESFDLAATGTWLVTQLLEGMADAAGSGTGPIAAAPGPRGT
jgi:TetR/AcrR family transcriptional regulator, acrAB operon repressor